MDTSLLKDLQVPGLILAGLVIYLQSKIILKLIDICVQLLPQLTEQRAVLAEMVGLLRQICNMAKIDAGGRE